MALPPSGQLSFSAIATELGISLSNLSLRSMSATAGFSTPDKVSDFYGYSNLTYTFWGTIWVDPCGASYEMYYGSNGKYYVYIEGSYVLLYTRTHYFFLPAYFDGDFWVWSYSTVDPSSTTYNYVYDTYSGCAPS